MAQIKKIRKHRPNPSRDEIREEVSGNLCRSTGYRKILDALELVARTRGGL